MHRFSAAVRCTGLKGLPVCVVHITKDRLGCNAERGLWSWIGLDPESQNAAQDLPQRPAILGSDSGSAAQAQQPDPHRDP